MIAKRSLMKIGTHKLPKWSGSCCSHIESIHTCVGGRGRSVLRETIKDSWSASRRPKRYKFTCSDLKRNLNQEPITDYVSGSYCFWKSLREIKTSLGLNIQSPSGQNTSEIAILALFSQYIFFFSLHRFVPMCPFLCFFVGVDRIDIERARVRITDINKISGRWKLIACFQMLIVVEWIKNGASGHQSCFVSDAAASGPLLVTLDPNLHIICPGN